MHPPIDTLIQQTLPQLQRQQQHLEQLEAVIDTLEAAIAQDQPEQVHQATEHFSEAVMQLQGAQQLTEQLLKPYFAGKSVSECLDILNAQGGATASELLRRHRQRLQQQLNSTQAKQLKVGLLLNQQNRVYYDLLMLLTGRSSETPSQQRSYTASGNQSSTGEPDQQRRRLGTV